MPVGKQRSRSSNEVLEEVQVSFAPSSAALCLQCDEMIMEQEQPEYKADPVIQRIDQSALLSMSA